MPKRLVAAAGLALLALPVPAAHAMSGKAAAKVALKALRPQSEKSKYVVVFGLPRPLGAKQSVIESGIDGRAEKEIVRARPIRRKAWLFWEDLEYGAKFRHPSRLVLVDDASGKVVVRRRMLRGWPLVDGKDPAFIKKRGHGDERYRVYTRLAPIPAQGSVFARPVVSSVFAGASQAGAFAPGTFKDDCLVTLVDRENFEADFQAVTKYFTGLGVRAFEVPRHEKDFPPNGADLERFVGQLTKICRDIIIYSSGHNGSGSAVDVGKATQVNEKTGQVIKFTQKLGPVNIDNILKKNKGTTFKIIIDSCNAGAFLTPTVKATALVAVTATNADQSSHTGVLFPGVPWNGSTFTDGLIKGMRVNEGYVARDASGASKAARLIGEGFDAGLDLAKIIGLTTPQHSVHLPEYVRGPDPNAPAPEPTPPSPPPTPTEPPPKLKPIQAEFVEGVTYTQYQVSVDTSRTNIDYAWSLTPPADDPTCTHLEQEASPRYARWYHGAADGCSHNGTQHNGVVKVVVTVHWSEVPKDWVCTATYNGTLSGTGPEPDPCVEK